MTGGWQFSDQISVFPTMSITNVKLRIKLLRFILASRVIYCTANPCAWQSLLTLYIVLKKFEPNLKNSGQISFYSEVKKNKYFFGTNFKIISGSRLFLQPLQFISLFSILNYQLTSYPIVGISLAIAALASLILHQLTGTVRTICAISRLKSSCVTWHDCTLCSYLRMTMRDGRNIEHCPKNLFSSQCWVTLIETSYTTWQVYLYIILSNFFPCSANLAIVKDLGDRAAQGRACGNLGNTHYLLGNFDLAIMYHEEVIRSLNYLVQGWFNILYREVLSNPIIK